MFVYLFSVLLSPICKRHCLSVESHLSVTEDCFLLKHFYVNSSCIVCLKTSGQEAIEKKSPLPSTPISTCSYIHIEL